MRFFLVFIIFLLLIQISFSFNLASLQKENYKEVFAGETTYFEIIFFSKEGNFTLNFEVEKPENITVFLLHDTIDFPLKNFDLYFNENPAIVQKIFVKTEKFLENKNYTILLKAFAIDKNNGNYLKIVQQRNFEFVLNVKSSFFPQKSLKVEDENYNISLIKDKGENNKNFFSIFILIFAAIIAYFIIKS